MRISQLSLATLIALALPSQGGAQGPNEGQAIRPQVVETTGARADDSTGRTLTVVVRQLQSPNISVQGALVSLTPGDSSLAWSAAAERLTNDYGIVTLPYDGSGYYELRVRRIGFPTARVRLWLPAECKNSIEVYLVLVTCDLGDCPAPSPARATLTTCRARAA